MNISAPIITAPEILCVYDDMKVDQTLAFFDKVSTLVQYGPVILDLKDLKKITAAASLMLFAIVNEIQLKYEKPKIISCLFPRIDKNPDGYKCVIRSGLSKALHSGTKDRLQDLVNTSSYYQSSDDADRHSKITADLLTAKLSLKQRGEFILTLSAALGEAMLNVRHHAYDDKNYSDLVSKIGYRWWQCAWYDAERRKIKFIIYDIGMGIAKSYISGNHDPFLYTEAHAIGEALTQGHSKFRNTERGNGSEDLKLPVGAHNETLLVYSGQAKYIYKGPMDNPRTEMVPSSYKARGTLIEWSLFL